MASRTRQQGKAIALFSDGTGNSSAKLFKTNVWRMYEVVDLGPRRGMSAQVAFYDNGVGTSSFKLFAVIAGIFGFGLKRNILRIYRFACRNYQPADATREADRIYAFGFSRGAFTIRLVVGLIAKEGLVRYSSERELNQRSLAAFRRFSRRNNPNFFPYFAVAGRFVRDLLLRLDPFRSAPAKPHRPNIEFVGVWDTVSAYGGPFAEITRAMDNWIWPLSMTDYQLTPKVKQARHALALDDERDSFHPLLWDEFKESLRVDRAERVGSEARAAAARHEDEGRPEKADFYRRCADWSDTIAWKYRTRLKQLWFAGMHSDVGGGYPDESLSFVSLQWMMEQVEPLGLRLLDTAVKQVDDMANAFGPLHNSRGGLAAYYRYQPRKIAAYLHPRSQPAARVQRRKARIMRETLSLRDPTMGEQEYRPQGLLLSCQVHPSVVARITSGTDDYAPITLPDGFEMTPPSPAAPPAGNVLLYDWHKWEKVRQVLTIPAGTDISPFADHQEAIWDHVLGRRFTYFVTILFTAGLLLSPLWAERVRYPDPVDRRWAGIVDFANGLLPAFLDPWLEVLKITPFAFAFLALLIWWTLHRGERLDQHIGDRSRELWNLAMEGRTPARSPLTRRRRWRNHVAYQRIVQTIKWRILPNLVFGPALVVLILYIFFMAGRMIWGAL